MAKHDTAGPQLALLGDEAAALGAIHAGLSAAYGYPGTPSTEIMEYLMAQADGSSADGSSADGSCSYTARWCVNEKTALEAALGTSFAGKRALITMKHVGLNVAADPLINAALLGIKGGLVIAAADDPGMHSSQNEQDSRFYAAFAMIPCLEPRGQQEAYDMCREAFDLSERFALPVILRLVTRLSHARAALSFASPRNQNPLDKAADKTRWMLLPAYARRNYADLIGKQGALEDWSAEHPANRLKLSGNTQPDSAPVDPDLAIITAGLGGNYYEENLADLIAASGGRAPARLHIGAYPLPLELIRRLCAEARRVIVLEEGQPFIEERLRGILSLGITLSGRLDGTVPRTGELDPDNVRKALGLPPRRSIFDTATAASTLGVSLSGLPGRPPQLCQGCPHGDSYETIKLALAGIAAALPEAERGSAITVTGDIGCYSLGANPPYAVPETIVCMGASIGMARGAADAGLRYAVAVIGDSTFLHSGITGLIDAVASGTAMTIIILDNSTVAMTGCQETILPSSRLQALILGAGVDPGHYLELEAKRPLVEENARRLREELEYRGLSVVVFKRECLEAARKRLRSGK
jgi:indolepyruvate ferredoxin oxidoreductase alpha subunit